MPQLTLRRRWNLGVAAFVVGLILISRPCCADVTLTFEGLQNGEPILNYFNGGFGGGVDGGPGSGPGPSYGIVFSSNAYSLTSEDIGGTGTFSTSPDGTPDYPDGIASGHVGVALIISGVVMNVPAGFQGDLTFWYTSAESAASVAFYDQVGGAAGGGTALGGAYTVTSYDPSAGGQESVQTLSAANGAFSLAPVYDTTPDVFTQWNYVDLAFDGTARSVQFGGSYMAVAFDQITLAVPDGGSTPDQVLDSTATVPEPSTLMAWSAFGVLGGLVFWRNRPRSVQVG